MEEAGIQEEEAIIVETEVGFRYAWGQKAVEGLLKLQPMPEAILAVTDSTAVGAKLALEKRGIRIPDDVALMGFNNESFTAFLQPALSTVSFPMRELGEEAITLLLKLLENETGENHQDIEQHIVLPAQVVIRGSSVRK